MATVSYGHVITQSDALPAPTKATLADTGFVAIDASGVLAPDVVKLAPGVYLLAPAVLPGATYAAACLAYAQAFGLGRSSAGGSTPITDDASILPVFAALPTGTWS